MKKIAESACDFIGNKITGRITKVSETLPQNNSKRITNKHNREIPKERFVSPEERQGLVYSNNY